MNFVDPSISLLAAAGRDTVKIFDVSAEPSDPCILSYTPSSGCLVNSVKWNHTNLVVASAGDDRKISLWKKNGQVMGTIPVAGTDSGDGIEESILSISFSNKGSRYICSGGSGQVVRIWDLQRKRCIKWLRGHTNTITGAMYNCKDEHLASISLSGDLILHNLASGVRASELKDPNEQVLRVLDYSRISRHLLVTAGDDGSVHLWDSTGRSPKVSWWKQHSAPTVGLSFSPSNDKIVASVGLDKKLYTFDTGSKKPSSCISYEAPFTSLAFRDDGHILVAGTSSGRVVFYDVRGKPQPFTVLRAYGNSEAVTSLCWQRSKPVAVDESNCSAETALLGGSVDDSILMPDPLPSTTSSSLSALSGSRKMGRPILSLGGSSSAASSGALVSSSLHSSMTEETPHHHHLWPGGRLARLHAGRSSFNLNDDMEVFSPLVEVQPITPSLDKLWDDGEGGAKKENLPAERKSSPLIFSSSTRKFLSTDDAANDHPIFDWKPSYIPRQDDTHSPSTLLGSSPAPSSTSEDSSVTPPEAWGGERFSDKFIRSHPPVSLPSRFSMPTTAGPLASGSMFPGFQDLTSSATQTSRNSNPAHSMKVETSLGSSELPYNYSMSLSLGTKGIVAGQGSLEKPVPASLSLPRRFSTYADRMSTTSSFSDAAAISVGSPKTKKIGAETREQLAPSSLPVGSPKTKRMGSETREELFNSLFSRSEAPAAGEPGNLPALNGGTSQSQKDKSRPDLSQGSSFTLQLFQRTLEETLATFQKSTHEDMRNLHIEVLRQFHMQEMEMSNVMSLILKNQAELMKEVQSLRKENQQLRQLL